VVSAHPLTIITLSTRLIKISTTTRVDIVCLLSLDFVDSIDQLYERVKSANKLLKSDAMVNRQLRDFLGASDTLTNCARFASRRLSFIRSLDIW
jgi:hypothetical protein